MAQETYSDEQIVGILRATRTIAMVGASPRHNRYSHRVMEYMQRCGYRVIPVNPSRAGDEILGELVYPDLESVPAPFEMVDVFRRMDAVPAVVEHVLRLAGSKGIRSLWLQVGLYDDRLAARARSAGLDVVMDRCVKIEYGRLLAHG
ncbi:MAG: CoA-binding protein [Pseudomonadota bacterium]